MRLVICPDYDAVAKWTANHIANRMLNFKPSENKPFVLGLPTGSSPLGVYKELIKLHQEKGLSFKHVISFNMDEYVGLDAKHPQSYHRFMWDNFFSHIDIKQKNAHILNGMASDLEAECEAYEQKILDSGGIELFLGGVGADGHLAFNEPGSSLSSRTRVKTLTSDTKNANSRFFDGDPNKVPSTALTVGVGTVSDAREVLIIASGFSKARALQAAIEGGVNHMCTLSCLQLHRKGIIVCDEEATDELRVGTVRYFKDIEKDSMKNLL
ncbi:glucosamine-6-phosphate deaminase [Treponema sp.]